MADADHKPAPPPTRPHERRLTVSTTYYPALARDRSTCGRPVPWIRLQGLWLQAAGFGLQQPLRVRIAYGRLVITIN